MRRERSGESEERGGWREKRDKEEMGRGRTEKVRERREREERSERRDM